LSTNMSRTMAVIRLPSVLLTVRNIQSCAVCFYKMLDNRIRLGERDPDLLAILSHMELDWVHVIFESDHMRPCPTSKRLGYISEFLIDVLEVRLKDCDTSARRTFFCEVRVQSQLLG